MAGNPLSYHLVVNCACRKRYSEFVKKGEKMIKHYCDKCMVEVPDHLLQVVEVYVNGSPEDVIIELCQACMAHLNWFLDEPSWSGVRKTIIDKFSELS